MIDTKRYGSENLIDEGLKEFQGAALLVYNDSVFTDRDFESLKRLGDSNKLQEKIATGRFGLGFSSVPPPQIPLPPHSHFLMISCSDFFC